MCIFKQQIVPSIDPNAVEQIPSEAASTYTKLAAAYGQEYYRSVAEKLAARLQPGDRLLDAGTGPGFIPLLIAEGVDDVRIHGFDFTHDLVAYGQREAVRRDVDDLVSFFTADCYAIPAAHCSYSQLLCTGVLHSLDEPVAVLEEFYRVLEPGGTAWVFDPAVLDVPDEPEIDLTEHEREVFEAYGVRAADEEPPLSRDQTARIVDDSPFTDATIEKGSQGDLRLYLSRVE